MEEAHDLHCDGVGGEYNNCIVVLDYMEEGSDIPHTPLLVLFVIY